MFILRYDVSLTSSPMWMVPGVLATREMANWGSGWPMMRVRVPMMSMSRCPDWGSTWVARQRVTVFRTRNWIPPIWMLLPGQVSSCQGVQP